MKPQLIILILAVAGLLSCNDDPFLPLTDNLVAAIKPYDLDNTGNSSDIRLDFIVKDNLNVLEYRIMILPSGLANTFDEGIATAAPSSGYLEIDPESFKVEYSIHRLPPHLLDINGSQIQNEVEYVAAILVVGTGNQQLSAFSDPFVLRNQEIYSGSYIIVSRELECVCEDGTVDLPNPTISSPRSYGMYILGTGNDYSGTYVDFFRDTADSVAFSVTGINGTTISDYLLVSACREHGGGSIIDELTLKITWTTNDCSVPVGVAGGQTGTCLAACNGTTIATRQVENI